MKIIILTLFPNLFTPFLETSIIGRATKQDRVDFEVVDLRQFGKGEHKTVDDRPFGGGAGMILKADILAKAWHSINNKQNKKFHTILTSASGLTYNQSKAQQLSRLDSILIICGHYEGVDQRFIDKYVDEEVSIGDYVLTGGEIPALVIVDSIVRLLPNVFKKAVATAEESFSEQLAGLLEYPQYTRPLVFEGRKVPKTLLSGNHAQIRKWRRDYSFKKTRSQRPDLLETVN